MLGNRHEIFSFSRIWEQHTTKDFSGSSEVALYFPIGREQSSILSKYCSGTVDLFDDDYLKMHALDELYLKFSIDIRMRERFLSSTTAEQRYPNELTDIEFYFAVPFWHTVDCANCSGWLTCYVIKFDGDELLIGVALAAINEKGKITPDSQVNILSWYHDIDFDNPKLEDVEEISWKKPRIIGSIISVSGIAIISVTILLPIFKFINLRKIIMPFSSIGVVTFGFGIAAILVNRIFNYCVKHSTRVAIDDIKYNRDKTLDYALQIKFPLIAKLFTEKEDYEKRVRNGLKGEHCNVKSILDKSSEQCQKN
jgi:hypothetical protein